MKSQIVVIGISQGKNASLVTPTAKREERESNILQTTNNTKSGSMALSIKNSEGVDY
jgi:hypothetical protein